jgi:hypothetical protein
MKVIVTPCLPELTCIGSVLEKMVMRPDVKGAKEGGLPELIGKEMGKNRPCKERTNGKKG